MKIFILGGENIGPYHYARFAALTKLERDFSYIAIPAADVYRPWGGDVRPPGFKFSRIAALKDVWSFMNGESPDVVVTAGYANHSLLAAAIWSKFKSVPLVLMNDSTLQDKPRVHFKEFAKRCVVGSLYDACFAAGQRSMEYAISLGIKADSIRLGVDVVDNEYFSKAYSVGNASNDPGMKYFLCVARLSAEKNIKALLSAFELYCEAGGKWGLVLAGTGPQEEELVSSVPERIRPKIVWRGWVSYSDLPSLYQNAGCFVLPSLSEPWGLVINEAMAAGLPLLVSYNCGAAPDLCKDGVNGFIFAPNDIPQLAEKMALIASERIDRREMGKSSKQIISVYTPEDWAQTLAKICRDVLRRRKQ